VARGLDGAGDLERELGEGEFVAVQRDLALQHQPAEVAVGGDIVEPVIVDADMGDMGGHVPHGLLAAELQHGLVARRVELQEGHAELEALGPFRPTARGVPALDRENRRAVGGIPGGVQGADLPAGQGEDAGGFLPQALRRQADVDFHGSAPEG
jgi:hypothetical protein